MPTTNFKNSSGTDIGNTLVEKSYLMDRYPELADTFKQAGLWAWGRKFIGLDSGGNNITGGLTTPVSAYGGKNNDWKFIATDCNYSCLGSRGGIKTDGTLWVWGQNVRDGYLATGQIDGTVSDKSTPVQIGANTWKQISMGSFHWMAIRTDGTLWGQGECGNFGKLGTGETTVKYSSPVQTIAGGTNWKSVVCGDSNTVALKTDGTLWVWGDNTYGCLGDGTTTSRSSPVQTVAGGTTWKEIALVAGSGAVLSIKTNGTLWSWGQNFYGLLANGTVGNDTHTSSPAQVGSETTWKQISGGDNAVSGIKTDGTLWSWGYNGNGALGDGTTGGETMHGPVRYSPVQIYGGGTNWKVVSRGMRSAMAIKTDGTLWGWGWNGSAYAPYGGGLGDGTRVDKSSPVQIYNGGTNWKTIAAGNMTSFGIRDDSADIFGNTL